MSDTATKTARPLRKHEPSPKGEVAPVKPPVKLRKVQPKTFASTDFHHTGQHYEIMHVTAGPDWDFFEDVLAPVAWASNSRKVAKDALQHRKEKVGSTIFVHSPHFFAMLNIDAVLYNNMGNPCGLKVTCVGPATCLETGEARPFDFRTGKALQPTPQAQDEAA